MKKKRSAVGAKKKAAKKAPAKKRAPGKPVKKKATGAKQSSMRGAARPGARSLADFCRDLPGATEDIKWGDNLIFSIGDKMFAGFEVDNEHEFAFKCDADDFDRLIEREGVIPAPYAAKYGWVKVLKKGALPRGEAEGLLRKAHGLIASCLSAKKQRELGLE